MRGLGRLFDIGAAIVPVDLQTATNTGKRLALKAGTAVTFVVFKAAGTAGDDPVISIQQHTAYTSGTSANLATITDYYLKTETVLDNDETWVKTTQAAGASITDPGGLGTSAESQMIIAFSVDAAQLSDGYTHVSLNIADVGGNAQLGCALYIVHDLHAMRAPELLGNLLRPGSVNA